MNYANQDYCIGRGLGAFKAKSGISDTVFLRHAVELHSNFLQRRSQGSTFAAVSTSDVRSVPIPAFEFPAQERIATILTTIDAAIGSVSTLRANLGAYQNRFEHTIANLSVAVENLSASESRIRDTDMAMEMTAYTRTQILTQAGTAMLAQANQSQQSVLSLLRG